MESTEGYVLGGLRYGDTSKIIRVFSRDKGKLSFIAKGAVRKNNKFGASVEPLSKAEFQYIEKKSGLHLLTGADLKSYPSKIISDSERLPAALSAIELLGATLPDADPHEEVYQLLDEFMAGLKTDDAGSSFKLFLHFAFQYIASTGWQIDLSGFNPALPFNYFTFDSGSFSTGGFAGRRFYKFPTELAVKLTGFEDAPVFTDGEIDTLRLFMEEYLSFHYDKKIKINSMEYFI